MSAGLDSDPDLMPLYDATNCLSSAAILTVTDGPAERIREALMEASRAAGEYEPGSEVGRALNVLIGFTAGEASQ